MKRPEAPLVTPEWGRTVTGTGTVTTLLTKAGCVLCQPLFAQLFQKLVRRSLFHALPLLLFQMLMFCTLSLLLLVGLTLFQLFQFALFRSALLQLALFQSALFQFALFQLVLALFHRLLRMLLLMLSPSTQPPFQNALDAR